MMDKKYLSKFFFWLYLTISYLYNRFRVFLGLLTTKYGIIGYFEYRDMPLVNDGNFGHTTRRMNAAASYDSFKPDDVVLLTYSKSGTHFTANLILAIYKKANMLPDGERGHTTFLELSGPSLLKMLMKFSSGMNLSSTPKTSKDEMSEVDSCKSPRVLSSHLHWDNLPAAIRQGKVKVVNCYRNPKDVACSMYTFYIRMGVLLGSTTRDEFLENFMTKGKTLQGDYWDYIRKWYANRNNKNVFNLQFEVMREDLEKTVKDLAAFLGVSLSQSQIDEIVSENAFSKRRKSVGGTRLFYRKGESGGWKSELTVAQNEAMDEWIAEESKGLEDLSMIYS